MAAFAAVTAGRLIALKAQASGTTVISQFGKTTLSVWRMPAALSPADWSISAADENGAPLNVVYVRKGNAANFEREFVVEYRKGTDRTERLATGRIVELGDFGGLDAALSAALLLAVELPR